MAVVCSVKAAPPEKDRHRVEDAACLALAPGTDTYWLLIELLFSLEAIVAEAALIFVDRHLLSRR